MSTNHQLQLYRLATAGRCICYDFRVQKRRSPESCYYQRYRKCCTTCLVPRRLFNIISFNSLLICTLLYNFHFSGEPHYSLAAFPSAVPLERLWRRQLYYLHNQQNTISILPISTYPVKWCQC